MAKKKSFKKVTKTQSFKIKLSDILKKPVISRVYDFSAALLVEVFCDEGIRQ